MSDPVQEIIEYCKRESFVNEMPNLGKMAEAADVANTKKDAAIEAARELLEAMKYDLEADNLTYFTISGVKHANDRYIKIRDLLAALPAPSTPATEGNK